MSKTQGNQMNTHDKISRLIDKLEAIPAMDFAARAKGFHDLRTAIEADRQQSDTRTSRSVEQLKEALLSRNQRFVATHSEVKNLIEYYEADRKRRCESDIPRDTLGRLYTGRATSGDQMIVWNALNAACATPPSGDRMPDSMRDFITGMAVSVDVSTCDDDADHRYFGTVTEVMDADDRHGVILLVQDAEPNFGRE